MILLKKTAALGAVAAAVMGAMPLLTAAPALAEPPCADVDIVFARGTSEAPGIGRVGQAVTDALIPQLGGRTVSTYGVNYPATYDFLAAADGANDATAHISSMAQQCPGTRIVLGGYSQGAAVVDMLAGIPPLGNKVGEIGSAPPLPSGLAANVAAAVVFGNPSKKFSVPLNSGQSQFGNRSLDLCADGDPICSDGRNPFAHTHYESSDYIGQAAGFIAARV